VIDGHGSLGRKIIKEIKKINDPLFQALLHYLEKVNENGKIRCGKHERNQSD